MENYQYTLEIKWQKNQECLNCLNDWFNKSTAPIRLQRKIVGFLLWALRHSRWLWRDKTVTQAKLLTITPSLWKPHTHTHALSNASNQQIFSTAAPPASHQPPHQAEYRKISVNPLVSAHGTPTALPLQGSAPSGLPGSIWRSMEGVHSLHTRSMPSNPWLSISTFYTKVHLCFSLVLFYMWKEQEEHLRKSSTYRRCSELFLNMQYIGGWERPWLLLSFFNLSPRDEIISHAKKSIFSLFALANLAIVSLTGIASMTYQ